MNHNELIEKCFGETSNADGRDLATVAECVVAGMAAFAYPKSAAAVARGTCLNLLIAQEVAASVLMRNGGDIGAAAAHMPAAVERTLRLIATDPVTADSTTEYQSHLRALIAKI